MAKPFDVTTKDLVEAGPLDWLRLLGLPGTHADVVDAACPRSRVKPTD